MTLRFCLYVSAYVCEFTTAGESQYDLITRESEECHLQVSERWTAAGDLSLWRALYGPQLTNR